MKYYSTSKASPEVSLSEAVIKGLAPDKGLYMPERIEKLDPAFFENISKLSLQEIAVIVAGAMFGEDVEKEALEKIVRDTLNFDIPVVKVEEGIYSLELFHGPTLAFKDVGGRFMARMLSYFIERGESGEREAHGESRESGEGGEYGVRSESGTSRAKRPVTVLVATSGDTGSAVANGFLGVEGIEVVVLYPKGKVSEIQEKQFTTLGKNITAIEVEGTFDDCQRLVKSAFTDPELTSKMNLTSANSINVARFLPQAFYYFNAYARLREAGVKNDMIISVPSGNFGNITAGLFAKRMGLPVKRFIAANNRNDVFFEYLASGKYSPRSSVETLANAMDVGDPSNFVRILDLYGNSLDAIRKDIKGFSYDDARIARCIKEVAERTGYLLEPHGACGYMALKEDIGPGETGVFLETAHPAKFIDRVEPIIGYKIGIPEKLAEFMKRKKEVVGMSKDFSEFKQYLLSRQFTE